MRKKIINNIFNYAAKEEAEKVIIGGDSQSILFGYNLPGGEERQLRLPKNLEESLTEDLRKILAIAPGELVSKKYCKLANKNYRLAFYLTILPDGEEEKIIINIVNREKKLWRLNQLGLQLQQLKLIKKTLKTGSGLIIISSPDNQGKSSTLFSLLSEINTPETNICLLDNNPEIIIPGINVLAANKTNWSLLIKHDCDVIAIDGLDNEETIKNALRSAASGKLVIATMAAKSSLLVLDKILAVGLPLKLKLDGLKMIINQRLADLKKYKSKNNDRKKIGLFEVLELSRELKDFVGKENKGEKDNNKFFQKLKETAGKNNFKTLDEDRRRKIKDGLLDE